MQNTLSLNPYARIDTRNTNCFNLVCLLYSPRQLVSLLLISLFSYYFRSLYWCAIVLLLYMLFSLCKFNIIHLIYAYKFILINLHT